MQKKFNVFNIIAFLSVFAALSMGVDSCKQPKEYCKAYKGKADQSECTRYCEDHKDLRNDRSLVQACQFGQLGYLSGIRTSAAELITDCDRHYKDKPRDHAKACRTGVTAEELRSSRGGHGPGSATDRETGNHR